MFICSIVIQFQLRHFLNVHIQMSALYFLHLLQEDKEAMFDVYDTVEAVLQIATGVIATRKVRGRADPPLPALTRTVWASSLRYVHWWHLF